MTHSPFESLERRVLLSGSVLAQVVDGNLNITGDAAANVIILNQRGLTSHQVRVISTGGTINGQVGSVVMGGVKGDVEISMGNGADSVALLNLNLPGELGISQGGRDTLAISNVTVGRDLSLNNGSSLLPTNSTIINTIIGHNLQIVSENGGQHINLQSVEVGGDTEIDTGKRFDVLTIDDSIFHNNVQMDMGSGDDVVKIEGAGSIHGPRTRFYAPTSIAMGAGDDTLQLGVAGQTGNRAAFSDEAHFDGGAGQDSVSKSNDSFATKPQFRNFETINPIIDITVPTVSSTAPANGATGIALNRAIAATFSEAMDPSTIVSANVTVTSGASVAVPGTVAYVGTTMTFTPTNALAANTTFTVKIGTGAKDLAGNALASNYLWSFTTGAAPDTIKPTVSSTDPANHATGVALNKQIAATFSEAMDPTTITKSHFKVTGPGSTAVAGVVTYVGSTATFSPTGTLAPNVVFTATVTTGVEDLAGNAMASDFSWSFTSGATPDTTAPTVSSTNPANAATGVALNKQVAATFSEAMDPTSITTADYTLKGPGTTAVIGTVATVGATVTFTPIAALAANTLFTAMITTGAKDLAGNSLATNKSWTFTTGAAPDTTAPTVSSTNPTDAKTNVALNKTISATFSESMDITTITTANIKVVDQNNAAVAGTVSYDVPSKIATFTPTANLAPSTTFTVTISGGSTGVTDLAHNPLAVNKVWTFTTGTQIAQATINLGRASTFAVLATASISGAADVINGDVGLHAGTSQGIPPSEINGTVQKNNQAVIDAQTDLLAAYNDAVSRSTTSIDLPGNLGGKTFTPGLYTNSSSVMLSGSGNLNNVTLDAQGDPNAIFIFKIGSTLTMDVGSQVILAGGAKAGNVFWQVGTSATLDTGSIFKGNILASATITVNNGSDILGRLFGGAFTDGAVTINSSTVTVPS